MKIKKISLCAAGGLFVSAMTSYAAVVFSEKFDNSTGTDAALSTIGWKANLDSTAVVAGTSAVATATPVVSVNNHMFFLPPGATPAGRPVLIWTDKRRVEKIGKLSSVTNFHFVLGTQNTSEAVKVAVKVNDAWYVSRTVFNGNGDNALTQTNDFAVQGAAWNSLNFVSGSVLEEAGEAVLPMSEPVQAVGFFDASRTSANRLRIDTLEISNADGE